MQVVSISVHYCRTVFKLTILTEGAAKTWIKRRNALNVGFEEAEWSLLSSTRAFNLYVPDLSRPMSVPTCPMSLRAKMPQLTPTTWFLLQSVICSACARTFSVVFCILAMHPFIRHGGHSLNETSRNFCRHQPSSQFSQQHHQHISYAQTHTCVRLLVWWLRFHTQLISMDCLSFGNWQQRKHTSMHFMTVCG